ncbi:MAG: DUF424 domain-containing protein [Candidatus Micrarchaeota archaeon]|nr:DUF424 domain-containing protein [Candidatus Micrarchaeota archaeon]
MIFVKKHAAEQGLIIAMCDEELMGRVLEEGKLFIDLDRYSEFYRGELVSEEKAKAMVDGVELYSANIVGERSVAVMMNKGIVGKEDVKKVGRVPFVQVFKVDF